MSDDLSKFSHSKRRAGDENAVKKQQRIIRQRGPATEAAYRSPEQANRFNKQHAMDCGRAQCGLCGNPRRTQGELTMQEQRLFQDLDCHRNRHNNGLLPQEDTNDE